MAITDIIARIDAEIAKLLEAKALLSGGAAAAPAPVVQSKRGRPKGTKNAAKTASVAAPAKKSAKRGLSPEGRKAISEALKRRWAERKKQAGK